MATTWPTTAPSGHRLRQHRRGRRHARRQPRPDGRLYCFAGRFPHAIHRPGGPVVHGGTAPPWWSAAGPTVPISKLSAARKATPSAWPSRPKAICSPAARSWRQTRWAPACAYAPIHCVDGAEYPVRDKILNEHRRTGELLPPLAHLGVAAASDLTIARSDALGAGFGGNLFSALFNMHKIMRHKIDSQEPRSPAATRIFSSPATPIFIPPTCSRTPTAACWSSTPAAGSASAARRRKSPSPT